MTAIPEDPVLLRRQIASYLRDHHTMTVATSGARLPAGVIATADDPASAPDAPAPDLPHAASVFYAVDDALRLVFLSRPSSLHGSHIGEEAAVACTITEEYDDWEKIQGVQVWGVARRLRGRSRAAALALYLARFPFVHDILKRPGRATLLRTMGVYRVEPHRLAFTDNTTGVFGRGTLEHSRPRSKKPIR